MGEIGSASWVGGQLLGAYQLGHTDDGGEKLIELCVVDSNSNICIRTMYHQSLSHF